MLSRFLAGSICAGVLLVAPCANADPGYYPMSNFFAMFSAAPRQVVSYPDKYEPGTIVAEGDYVIVHGRFSNTGGPRNWIAADVVRVVDDVLVDDLDGYDLAGASMPPLVDYAGSALTDSREQVVVADFFQGFDFHGHR